MMKCVIELWLRTGPLQSADLSLYSPAAVTSHGGRSCSYGGLDCWRGLLPNTPVVDPWK